MKMKIKLVFLSLILALLTCGFPIGKSADAAGDQQIDSQVTEFSSLPISTEIVSSSTSFNQIVLSGNQTIETKNPTFKAVRDFILKDTTNRNTFIAGKYECRHFATDVNNNAEAAGIKAAFVLLCYTNGQHAVIGFKTTDRGMIYIEPQTDAAIQPVVGGYYQGQKIIEILIAW